MTETNNPELRPERTVDHLEQEALSTEAPGAKHLADRNEPAKEPGEDGTEPAFEQDMEVEDLPGHDGGAATEPAD